ncbi:16S rRNA processing protein RimM [Allosphingosinicella flava]|uniref:Ribosome maturation factor RimM n=1 Tax=Allosphingosinicella flava TaxID=2771430 RepID=A0A7T2GKZ6_9SPHN|nr:ribosome maturation factor RimM [Sphingosinicella flava]QPQ55798.1 16S rRNA processing protein RimM [Sphingosinicella flava]
MNEPTITLAAIAGAHGISGEVRLKLFAESVESLRHHKTVQAGERTLTLKSVKEGGGMPIARFAEVADRSAAEALRGTVLTVPRSALPPLEEGEYYHADLIGLSCVTREGEEVGTVAAVENFGAGDLLEIERTGGKKVMIPFKPTVADLEDGKIVVDPAFVA